MRTLIFNYSEKNIGFRNVNTIAFYFSSEEKILMRPVNQINNHLTANSLKTVQILKLKQNHEIFIPAISIKCKPT